MPAVTLVSTLEPARAPALGPTVPITLAELAAQLGTGERRGDAALVDATHDSRAAAPGSLFCAIAGERTDGHVHAPEAVAGGASALLVQRFLELDIPQLRVDDVRSQAGRAAALVHDRPSTRMDVVGVTGTNGKTTTTWLVEHAAAADGRGAGLIGTIGARVHGQAIPGQRTTPEGPDLQRLLAHMHTRGADVVAMEVSSHGMALHRMAGTRVAVAVFLNLTQDHLDFHGSMTAYMAAKASLFQPEYSRAGIVCVDDQWGRELAEHARIPVTTFGGHDANWTIQDVVVGLDGTSFTLVGPAGREVELATRLVGRVNTQNVAAAYLAALKLGISPEAAAAGISACPGVPGRLEPVPNDRGIGVVVDYAHTPDAVAKLVATGRELADGGRVIVVVGCGGDRDRAKRAPMGAAAAAADLAILTSDNPRSEDPETILDQMQAGALEAVEAGALGVVQRQADRHRAIQMGIEAAGAGDMVIIAGKGHETGQQFADHTIDFDDRLVAAEILGGRS